MRYKTLWLSALGMVFAAAVPSTFANVDAEVQGFSIQHYFQYQRISELALSHDGGWVAYITSAPSLNENRWVQKLYVQETTPVRHLST
jgi:hypothetical protein